MLKQNNAVKFIENCEITTAEFGEVGPDVRSAWRDLSIHALREKAAIQLSYIRTTSSFVPLDVFFPHGKYCQ